MQKIISSIMSFIAIFLCVFWGYNDSRVQSRLTSAETQQIVSSALTLKVTDSVKESSDSLVIEVTNHTLTEFTCSCEPDIEVLTDNGWYDVAKTTSLRSSYVKGTVGSMGQSTLTVSNLNTFHIVKGYTYRIILTFEGDYGTNVVTAAAEFSV